ncbi:cupin domain-containing protein, partial [Burkholderia gladioli]|uniref:cupin domain-containing protein n=1 Tax=Burkholderia gladioli TaxID=28095 RepID=UPI0024457820
AEWAIMVSGEVRIVDSHNFPVSKTVAAALVTVKPGGLRELHWHQQAEWAIMVSGEVRIVDSHNFPVSKTVAAALVTVKPGGLRELH